MPLMLWVSLYRIFYMGRVFNFLGMCVEKSNISLTFGDFYHSVPSPTLLWRPSSSSTDSSAPDPSQPCCSCSQCMPCSCPAVQRGRVAQLSPSQPAWSPLDPPAHKQPHVPTCRALSPPVQYSCSRHPSVLPARQLAQFQPLLFVPRAPGVGVHHLGY